VKTFTIGFHEAAYNEADQAKFVARHLGCDHTEFYVTPADATAIVPSLPALYDEPFADSSQIPMVMISRLARRSVTVTLSGDGGDESFGGYTRYWWNQRIWRAFGWMSPRLRCRLAGLLSLGGSSDKLQKLALLLRARDRKSLYASLLSNWNDPLTLVLHGSEHPALLTQIDQWPAYPDFFQTMMFLDTATYLPDDVLVKLDRATMSVGLEARAPLLDHRLIEFAWQLPMRMKVRGGQGKWLLRRVAAKYFPPAVLNRPKRGFGIPLHEWLRGPLRNWAGDLLDPGRLRREQFIDPEPIQRRLAEHLAGRRNWGFSLWNVLMFEAWLQEQARPNHAPQFEAATFHARA
jgi:asparagine synthase (glutamine-hydrolysing)